MRFRSLSRPHGPSAEHGGCGLLSGGNPHLRSTKEVAGYYVQASDGDVGRVEDLVVDDEDWAIRCVVVDTRKWLSGKKV